jgi:tetratricopeptide (TPR) repeat protein
MYVHGLEGLGVSCLVTQFSKDYRGLIDGPLIWLAGRRLDGQPVPVSELLAHLLRALGVPDDAQGSSDTDRVNSYHRVSRGRAFMVVVDDLVTPAQILSLKPSDAPRAVVVATTSLERRTLDSEGFAAFTPDLLPAEDSRSLFRTVLGETAGELAESTVHDLVEMCGGIPLLVKVLAAQIRGRARMAERLLIRLRASKLDLLALDDERRMAQFLDTTYQALPVQHAQAWRWLSLLPGAEFSLEAAAAVLAIDANDAFMVVEQLVEFHLLTVTTTDRYAFHPVLREDARIRSQRDDDLSVRVEVTERGLTWYLREALPRGAAVSNRWWVSPVIELMDGFYGGAVPSFSRSDALAWFEIEAANLIAAVRAANRQGLHGVAWPLCVALWKYLHIHKLYDAWIDTHRDGLASARAEGNVAGVMQLSSQLGAAHLDVGEYAEASRYFEESLVSAQALTHVIGEQSALEWLGKVAAAEKRLRVALEFYQQSWDVIARASDTEIDPAQKERAFALLWLQQARAYTKMLRWSEALTAALSAEDYFDRFDNETDNRAKTRLVRGQALLGMGEAEEAVSAFEAAMALFAGDEARRAQADTQRWLGQALITAGQSGQAVNVYRDALAYYQRMGSPLADDVAAALEDLDG